MRSIPGAIVCLLVLMAPALAQEGGGEKKMQYPPWWSEEDYGAWVDLGQQIRTAFDTRDYSGALDLLETEMALLQKVKGALEEGKTELPEHEKLSKEQIVRAGLRTLTGSLAACWYNKACALSLTGATGPAVEALKKSITLGYVDVDHFRKDPDLDPIRDLPGYKEALGLVEYNDVFAVHVPEGLGDAPAPLLVVLHSAKSNERNIIKLFSEFADQRKMILAAPRAPITQGVDEYLWKSYSSGKESAVKKIAATLSAVKGKHSVDPTRIFLIGARQGGEIAWLYAIRNPGTVKGALQMNSYWNRFEYGDEELLASASRAGLKLCLIHGKEDPFFGKAKAAAKHFAKAEIPAKLIEFDGGREFPENLIDLIGEALDWMK